MWDDILEVNLNIFKYHIKCVNKCLVLTPFDKSPFLDPNRWYYQLEF